MFIFVHTNTYYFTGNLKKNLTNLYCMTIGNFFPWLFRKNPNSHQKFISTTCFRNKKLSQKFTTCRYSSQLFTFQLELLFFSVQTLGVCTYYLRGVFMNIDINFFCQCSLRTPPKNYSEI